MRVLHVISGMFYGGGQQVVLDLREGLSRVSDVQVELAILGDRDAKMAAVADHRVSYDGRYNRPATLWRLGRDLRQVVRQAGPDVVHSHGWDASMASALALRGTGMPHVVHWHTTDDWLTAKSVRQGIRRSLTRWCFGRPRTEIVTVADTTRQHLAGHLHWPSSRLRVVHNGIDAARYEPNGTLHGRNGHEPMLIGTAARLMPVKGVEYLVDAVAAARKAGVAVECRVAGEGSSRSALEARAVDRGVSDRVHWLGRVEDMRGFYRGLDVFVLPSLSEGLPLTLLEAMASGVPVLPTRVGGVPEAVRDGEQGLLVEPRDTAALAEALRRLASSPDERAAMGRRARQRVVSEFTIERVAERFVAIYDELLLRN